MDSNPPTIEPLKEGRQAAALQERSVPAGTVVFREGDTSREVYIALQGSLSVTKSVEGKILSIAEISEHGVFGEMSLLDNLPRSGTVTAQTDCRLVVVSPAAFVAILRTVPTWFQSVLKVVARRLREANERIHGHGLPDPAAGFCLFLSIRTGSDATSLPWLPLVDEFHLVSRLSREEIRRVAQQLIDRGLVRIDSRQNLTIIDPHGLAAQARRPGDGGDCESPSSWSGR